MPQRSPLHCLGQIPSRFSSQLFVYHLEKKIRVNIPLLQGDATATSTPENCGIHSIAINPSRTLLATGGVNPSHIGIYRLPSFEPLLVCEVCACACACEVRDVSISSAAVCLCIHLVSRCWFARYVCVCVRDDALHSVRECTPVPACEVCA